MSAAPGLGLHQLEGHAARLGPGRGSGGRIYVSAGLLDEGLDERFAAGHEGTEAAAGLAERRHIYRYFGRSQAMRLQTAAPAGTDDAETVGVVHAQEGAVMVRDLRQRRQR